MKSLKTITDKVREYFDPSSNAGKNFWSTPVAQSTAYFQQTNPLNFLSGAGREYNQNLFTGLQQQPNKIAQTVGRFGENQFNAVGTGVNTIKRGITDIGQGTYKAITQIPNVSPQQSMQNLGQVGAGVGRTLMGAGQTIASMNPVVMGLRGLASTPQAQNLNVNVMGNKVNVPETLTSMYEFTKDPVWGKIFPVTSKLLSVAPTTSKVANFLVQRSAKGGIEGLIQGWSTLPQKATTEQKINHYLTNVGFGAASEITLDAFAKSIGWAGDKSGLKKEMVKAVDSLGQDLTKVKDYFTKTVYAGGDTKFQGDLAGLNRRLKGMGINLKNQPAFADLGYKFGDTQPTKGGEIKLYRGVSETGGSGFAAYGKGKYLTDNPEIARYYAGSKGKIEETFLGDVKLLDAEKFKIDGEIKDFFKERYIERGFSDAQATKALNNILDYARNNKNKILNFRGELEYVSKQVGLTDETTEQLSNLIKKRGYDGIKYLSAPEIEGAKGTNYVLYNKSQGGVPDLNYVSKPTTSKYWSSPDMVSSPNEAAMFLSEKTGKTMAQVYKEYGIKPEVNAGKASGYDFTGNDLRKLDKLVSDAKKQISGGVPEGGMGGVKPPVSTEKQIVPRVEQGQLATRQVSLGQPQKPQLPEQQIPRQTPSGGTTGGAVPPKTPQTQVDSSSFISNIKSKANKLYTEAIDRFHPLSVVAKQAGEDKAMREALTGHYGAGSTAEYHVDFELTPILKEQNMDDLRRAAIAMRDVELKGRDIKGSNTGDPIKNLENLTNELGAEKMKSVGETLKKLYAYQDKVVQEYLVKTGIMSKSSYEAMRKNNQFYVPFKRVMDQVDDFLGVTPQNRGAGSVSGQNVIKGIKGSDRQIIDPIESILESTYKMVGLGKRQQVAQTIVGLKNKLPQGMIQKITGNIGNKSSISLFENGKVQHYSVPPEIADAAKGLSEEGLNTIVKILSVPTQVFRATATGINPEFAIPNVARDLQSAFVNVGLNPLKWVRGLSHLMKKDELYQEFLKAGGKTSRISIDRPMLQKTVEGIDKGVKISKPSDLLKILQNVGEYSEQPTRIAMFEDAIRKGKTPIEAANLAQEGTVNFARRGSKTQSINAIYAFLNARVQGVDRMIRTVKNDPVGGSARIAAITLAPALALYAWNRNFESYDDTRVVSDTDRRTNFIIMLSDQPIPELGGAQFIKIPKAEIGKIANPIEEFAKFADNKGGEVKKALFDTLKAFSPMDNMGDLIPTALRPPVEVAANKNFFYDLPIVPEYKKNYPAGFQDTSYTSPVYRMVGQKLNVSPAKIQAIVEGYGTGIAKIAELSTRGLIPDKYSSAKNEQGAEINKIPVARRIFGGEKRTEEEQTATDISRSRSIDFQIRDIESGIRKGDISFEAGAKKLTELRDQQSKLLKISKDEEDNLYVTKLQMANKPDGSLQKVSDSTYVYRENGETKTLKIDPIPEKPKTTGLIELDKKIISKYKTALTNRSNDIVKMWELGIIDQGEAEKLLKDITNLKGAGKKPKKISVGKISIPKVNIKKTSVKRYKAKKLATFKIKSTKAPNISIKAPSVKKYSLKTSTGRKV